MSAIAGHLPALQVILPLFGALLVALLRHDRAAFAIASIVSWLLPAISAALLHQVLTGGTISYALGGWPPPWGIEYRVDLLGAFILMLVSAVAAFTMPYAGRSVPAEVNADRAWFYSAYLLCIAGLLGLAVTGDAFNAFVFLEISSLATYALIAMGRDRRALLSAFQYLIVGTVGATFYVIGVGFLYLLTGSLNMVDIASRLGPVAADQSRAVIAALTFITVGISIKLALFPLHFWLPNAYAYAPSWVTVFLSATATKVAIYLLVRFYFSVFGVALAFDALLVREFVVFLALAAMFIASIIAIYQADLKRMMAYSSLAQIGYIMLGIGLANQDGLTGGLIHIVNHAITKAALFMAVGAVVFRLGSARLADMAGLGHKMPFTMAAFTVAAFGIIGAPGTAGFVSKWYLGVGALAQSGWPLVLLIVASSLISVIYLGRVMEMIWFRPASAADGRSADPPVSMLIPILVFAAASLYFGLDTRLTAGIAGDIATALIAGLK